MLAGAAMALTIPAGAQAPTGADEMVVFAAGSLRAALTETAASFERAASGRKVRLVFGASGLLAERIRNGERADVFASANMEHPQSLLAAGRAERVQAFARNALCALAAPRAALTSQNLVERMLDPAIKLGTSTPKADPSGDYAFELFARIEQAEPVARRGVRAALEAKALQLTGGPNSPPPPTDRNVYGVLVASGQADVFITYCTNATLATREQPALQVIDVPEAINVGASYGVARLKGAPATADDFVAHLLGTEGQAVLRRHGFLRP
jgi:ABC-type molybdate transport system substrate-binding protein